jgi:hypothetical protein
MAGREGGGAMKGWEYIGDIGVDSGTVMLVDPGYVLPWDETGEKGLDYGRAQGLDKPEHRAGMSEFELGGQDLGVLISSGFGDGMYPVYVRRAFGRIAELRVEFIEHEVRGAG